MDHWNKALTEVADLKGINANGRRETVVLDETVKYIYRRLRISSRFPLPRLFGMDDSIQFVTSWLKDAPHILQMHSLFWVWVGLGRRL
ncbi:hypothetical protein L2E82_29617 [Cichorium intybus]|uniref:Uncharacterized protein n=1 Tax=Cichorium intybus TaxID=13427 RepID=A0ACB9CYH5_CICIN|nr:hypothetical protein L2E82_29617 [Cichorium intybus]